jgi:cytochrome c-type biogenesis protein CcmF
MTGAAVVALGVPFWSSGLCFALCGFVTATIAQEFLRAGVIRRHATGTDLFTAMAGLIGRERRRYGGYIVHIGIVLAFLGFAGGGFERSEEAVITPGQQISVGPYAVKYVALSVTNDAQKQMVTAEVDTFKNGEPIGKMYPARWFFNGRESEPTTEVALRRGFADDLYIVLAGYDAGGQSAKIKVKVNPLVNWIWLGVGIMAIGTFLALLPARAFAFAAEAVPEGAATTTLMLVLMIGLGGARLLAQHEPSPDGVITAPKSAAEKRAQGEIVCMCGTCGRQRISDCTCPIAEGMRVELAGLVAKGMTNDQVIDYFVKKYGSQEVLASPIDTGFNRLAWLLPYGIGVVGVVAVGRMAVRWSHRRGDAADVPVASTTSAALEHQLDDELRDLD